MNREPADMDEDDLREYAYQLEEDLKTERDRAERVEWECEDALENLADSEAIRTAAVAYLTHVRELRTFVRDGAVEAWRMYEAQLRADLVDALGVDNAQAGLLLMTKAS